MEGGKQKVDLLLSTFHFPLSKYYPPRSRDRDNRAWPHPSFLSPAGASIRFLLLRED
jgi:hypothetical protein